MTPFKSTSPDCIHPRILRECNTSLAPAIKIIFDHSLASGTLPQNWKNGTITPIHKGDDKHQACNYRPITLTSLLCRMLEKLIKKDIMKHLLENELLIKEQHGFVPRRSCMTNLLCTLDAITELFDQGNAVDEIFLDFQKAFDKVPHQRLLYKVEKMGISGNVLNWIEAFLSNRKQRVSIRGKHSKWSNVLSGVPQGSVLGPLLFLIFINDIGVGLNSLFSIFADDSKIFHQANTVDDAELIQEDLNTLQAWCIKWKMDFNIAKCHVLHFGKKNSSYIYHLCGSPLNKVSEEKDLGVLISEDLKPYKNIQENIKKANKMIGMVRRTFSFLDKNMFLRVYKAFIRPQLEYCQQIISPFLKSDIDELEKVQRRATKLLHSIKDLPYEERLQKLDLYSLAERRLRGDMIFTFQILKGFSDIDASKIFSKVINRRTRGHSMKLEFKNSNCEIRKQFFTNRIITPWNKLSQNIIDSETTEQFKWRYDKEHGYHN